jgi:DtxR family Mn-dependent transcriptional regulator
MSADQLLKAVQDYLKAIYALDAAGVRVTTSALAERMDVSAPSATGMMKRLAELGLAERSPYRGVVLTEAAAAARSRCSAIIACSSATSSTRSGCPSTGCAEADRLEHALSEELEARIDEALGFPTHDPHGDPIPDRELKIVSSVARALLDLSPGDRATVSRASAPTIAASVTAPLAASRSDGRPSDASARRADQRTHRHGRARDRARVGGGRRHRLDPPY